MADIASERARLARREATAAADYADELGEAVVLAEARVRQLEAQAKEASHADAMGVLAARRAATAQASAYIEEADRAYAASARQAAVVETAAAAAKRGALSARERPIEWLPAARWTCT